MGLEPGAHQDREFSAGFIKLIPQAHESEHHARAFIEGEKYHFAAVVEMRELISLRGAELRNTRPKSQPQILRAHVLQEIRV